MKILKQTHACLGVVAVVSLLALSACGGGGDGGSTASSSPSSGSGSSNSGGGSTSPTPPATTGNVPNPQYGSSTVELAMFNAINTARTTCGFNALTENTILDKAAAAHASYMIQNGGKVTDTETAGQPGYTGASYADRAVAAGFPSSVYLGGESAGFYTNATLNNDQYGANIVNEWLTGVYHIAVAVWPVNEIGVGQAQQSFNGFPNVMASNTIANLTATPGNLPLTYPCEGVTGAPYEEAGESPTPPNVSGAYGTPVAVAGNPTDKITLSSGTMTDTQGNVITLQVLNSATDPNKLLPAFEAVAYPANPLQPNVKYSVTLNGTYNGQPFTRTFSFTTGNSIA